MEYSLNAGVWNEVFAVPSGVVDKYIKLASGNALKLLLFLLRHGGKKFDAEILRAELGFEELGELEDAALFWVQRGIISADNGKNAVKLGAAAAEDKSGVPADAPAEPPKRAIPKAKPPVMSGGEIAKSINSSPEMKALFAAAENLFGKGLSKSDSETISNLTGYYGLPCDVALMLIGYCTNLKEKRGKKITANYISTVAQNWSDEEIMTVRLADEKIRALERQSGVEQRLCEKMGLTSNLSKEIRNLIKIWTCDWGFGEDMIMLAYDETIDNTGSWSKAYINKILENWKNQGIATPQEAMKSKDDFKKAKVSKKTQTAPKRAAAVAAGKPSFDTDRLKAQVMKNYIKNSQG